MEKTKTVIQDWPGGISTLAGGTRTAIKLNRPWQTRLNIDPATCPFEPFRLEADGRKIVGRSSDGRWASIENRFTPNVNHVVVIPTTCENWPDARVRLLGGRQEIAAALSLVRQVMATTQTSETAEITVNIGWCGGQNVGHIHWHTFALPSGSLRFGPGLVAGFLKDINNPAFTLFEQDGLRLMVGGHRAGQCFILPNRNVGVHDMAGVISSLVSLYANNFQNSVGERLAPDFTLGLIYDRGEFVYGTYVPVLNHWGATEYAALLGQQAVTLPWPHEMTAAYLRGEIKI